MDWKSLSRGVDTHILRQEGEGVSDISGGSGAIDLLPGGTEGRWRRGKVLLLDSGGKRGTCSPGSAYASSDNDSISV